MTTENQHRSRLAEFNEPPKVTFLGTADAFNGGGSANSCYWVHDNFGEYCIDFGPTALAKSKEFNCDFKNLDLIMITHLHGDHIAGLPLLLLHLTYEQARTRPLYIAGPRGTLEFVNHLWEGTYPSTIDKGLPFEVRFVDWSLEHSVELLGRRVDCVAALHDIAAQAHCLKIHTDQYSLAVSGDTGWCEELISLSKGVDLFICESTNCQAGYWGHLSVEEHRTHRHQLSPKKLVLSHLNESARTAAEPLSEAYNWIVAHDGLVLSIK